MVNANINVVMLYYEQDFVINGIKFVYSLSPCESNHYPPFVALYLETRSTYKPGSGCNSATVSVKVTQPKSWLKVSWHLSSGCCLFKRSSLLPCTTYCVVGNKANWKYFLLLSLSFSGLYCKYLNEKSSKHIESVGFVSGPTCR